MASGTEPEKVWVGSELSLPSMDSNGCLFMALLL